MKNKSNNQNNFPLKALCCPVLLATPLQLPPALPSARLGARAPHPPRGSAVMASLLSEILPMMSSCLQKGRQMRVQLSDPCPSRGEVEARRQRLGGWVLCIGVSRLPSDTQAWVPSTHTPRYPRPAHRRPDGGNPGAGVLCTPPPRRGSGFARWLLSCKRGHGGLGAFRPHRQQIPGVTNTHTGIQTHTHPELLKYTQIQLQAHTLIHSRIQAWRHTQIRTQTLTLTHPGTSTHTHTLPWGYTLKQKYSQIYQGSQRHRDTFTHIHMHPQNFLETQICVFLHIDTCRHTERKQKHSHRDTEKRNARTWRHT